MKHKISQFTLRSLNRTHTSWLKHCVAINTVCIIHTSLKEVWRNATLDGITVQWWHKCFMEGRVRTEDNSQFVHTTTVINNIKHRYRRHSTRHRLACNGKRDKGRNWNTTNYSLPYFNWTFVQNKVTVWCVPCASTDA